MRHITLFVSVLRDLGETLTIQTKKVMSVMGRDDSWPATIQFIGESDPETPRMAELYFRSRI